MEAASSSSLDEAIMGLSSLLPQDDFRAYQDLLKQVAANLGLKIQELKVTLHSLVDILAAAAPYKMALPINKKVMGPVKALWQIPSLPYLRWGVEKKYYVLASEFQYLYLHPLRSLVVSAANERGRQGQSSTTPKQKDVERLDLFRRKVYLMGSLQLHTSNQQALLVT